MRSSLFGFAGFASFASLLAVVGAAGCSVGLEGEGGGVEALAGRACNGHVELCDRSVADVAFATTHNAFSTRGRFTYRFFNQNREIGQQLRDGIRGLMIDTYWHDPWGADGRAALCHGNCTIGGYIDLIPELQKVRAFLDERPDEVIALFVEQHSLSPGQFEEALAAAGLEGEPYAHPSPTRPWPTLAQLIDSRQRLLVFYFNADPNQARPAWYMPMHGGNLIENEYKASSLAQMSCELRAEAPSAAPMFFLNHFLSNPAGDEGLSKLANPLDAMRSRVFDCERQRGQLPNFVAVDFYEQDGSPGDQASVVQLVDELNGV